MYEHVPCIYNSDGSVKHISKEGSRYHILYYDSEGAHCSEKNCEINKKGD